LWVNPPHRRRRLIRVYNILYTHADIRVHERRNRILQRNVQQQ
jgi:hypothetical protein